MSVVLDAPVELWPTSSSEDKQAVIRAVYKQVLGNPHVMESERLTVAESKLCDGSITVREFVRAVAKSDFYRSRYFEACAPYRFVELNFKHLLGRAPLAQEELSEHIRRCTQEGYEAEIDSTSIVQNIRKNLARIQSLIIKGQKVKSDKSKSAIIAPFPCIKVMQELIVLLPLLA